MNASERKKAAKSFIKRWENRGKEKQDSQSFWIDLLHSVYGIDNPSEYIVFEDSVANMMDGTSYLDGYIDKTHVLIEQKSIDKDLNKGIRQSDGTYLTPFQQAQRYSASLPYSKRPRWIITSNFKEFYIYDMEKPNSDPAIVELENLEKDYYRLEILVDKTNTQIEKQTEVSIKAGELIGEIYDELLTQYNDPDSLETLESINQLSVRLVFCFYAEDSGLFGKKGMFHDFLAEYNTQHFRTGLLDLFKVLNTKIEDRDPYLHDSLAQFPYVNGGLFEEAEIEVPLFTDHLKELILKNASSEFDWSKISPTVFGGVFESTLNPEERHSGGMHYTSIENIHKVIDPLFLDDLKEELNEIRQLKQPATIKKHATEFQRKLSKLTFLDPAAGSGNFLTETYIALRELENEALVLIHGDNVLLDTESDLIKVTLDQFYGIEINDFAVSVAKTALWIAENQMFEKTKDLIYSDIDYLPIKSYANIVLGNALKLDWNDVVKNYQLNYIIGNPPFIGARVMSAEQTKELTEVFENQRGVGNLDYVAAWYKKAVDYLSGTSIRSAFVSTNSITQGQQVSILWKKLLTERNIIINFAYRTFNWNSEAVHTAAVHCVIIGFSQKENQDKKIFISDEQIELASNINGYLLDSENIFIDRKTNPISDVPKIKTGSMPNGKQLVLSSKEKESILKKYPQANKIIRKFIGADEYINNKERYCLWIEPQDLQLVSKINPVMNRLNDVKEQRLNSARAATKKLSAVPYEFGENRQPHSDYLLIPETSSENRRYIPIGFIDKDIIASNSGNILPNAKMYHFSILLSNVHMSWMRRVAGRLESRYRYSATIVYNNFPWPKLSETDKNLLNRTGQAILDARELYPEMSLADLYNELIMPPELRKAHQENDKAVMKIYGLDIGKTTEADAVAKLFELYEKEISKK